MRVLLLALLLAGVVSPFRGGPGQERPPGSQRSESNRSAAAVLADMRQALGGEVVLDSLQSLSATCVGRITLKGMSVDTADEYFLLLPDRYMRVRRLFPNSAARIDARLSEGFSGNELIRAVPTPRGSRPIDSSGHRRALAKLRHDAARWMLALTGRAMPDYPLQFAAAGTEEAGGTEYDIVEARGPADVLMRLYVERKTHLPAMVTTTGLEATAELRWLLSDFKKTGSVLWPRQIEEQIDGGLTEAVTVRTWKLNPKISPRIFQPSSR